MPDKLSGVRASCSAASPIASELELIIELKLPVISMSPDKLSFSESEGWSLILKYEGKEFTFSDRLELGSFENSISSS